MLVRIWIDGIGPFDASYTPGSLRGKEIDARHIEFPFASAKKAREILVESPLETFTLTQLSVTYERLNPLSDGRINFFATGQR